MELWLAVFGLAAAVLMIWLSRNRHRDDRSANGGTSGGVENKKGNGGVNGHGTDGDAGSGGDGGGGD